MSSEDLRKKLDSTTSYILKGLASFAIIAITVIFNQMKDQTHEVLNEVKADMKGIRKDLKDVSDIVIRLDVSVARDGKDIQDLKDKGK